MVRRRDALVAVVIAIAAGIAAASPAFGLLHGLSIDALTALRWFAFGPARAPATSPTVIVALDEEAYRTPPFAGTPGVFWTREIGRVVTAVIDGGAKVVGFDVVFPTSIEQSELPFGDETLGAKLRGFDRDFLRALATASQSGKIVLGQVQHQDQPILPSPGQRAAVGHMRNIRALNVYTDRDNVVRRVPLTFEVDGATVPSMAVELAARAQGAAPERAADGAMTLAGYRIPGAVPNTMTLNFEGGAGDIPTYSLGDLRACAEKGDTDFFRRHFGGTVVLVGAVLDAEDRKLTGNWKTSTDTAFGINFNPAGDALAFGSPDKSARIVSVADGKEILRLDQHTDWCLGALFTADGKRILSCGRDQAMKLKGTTVYPAAVQRCLQGIDGIIDYILIATAPTPLSDELEVVLAWRGDSSGAAEMVLEKLRGDLKVGPSVRIATLQEIQTLGDSRELRKQRVFLDRRNLPRP